MDLGLERDLNSKRSRIIPDRPIGLLHQPGIPVNNVAFFAGG